MDVQNQNNDDQWIQIADRASDIILTAITFSPVNTPGPVECVSKDCKPNDFFYIYFGKNTRSIKGYQPPISKSSPHY